MIAICRRFFLLLILLANAVVVAAQSPFWSGRHEFAAAISTLEPGMPTDKVLVTLGKPDDICTERDIGQMLLQGTKEIWRYGTSGHLTPATLGEVFVGHDDKVQGVVGAGKPPPDGMFMEQELRDCLTALGELPPLNAWRYDPRLIVRAVNLLQPLGKERAMAVIDEHRRVACRDEENLFLLLRALFDVPDDPGHMPAMLLGAPAGPAPDDPKLLPHFPLVFVDDIPFLLVEGYNLSGVPESVDAHIEYFRRVGTLRKRRLSPSANPFASLAMFEKSPQWTFREDAYSPARGRFVLQQQALRMVDTVYRVEPEIDGDLLPYGDKHADARNKIVAEAAALDIHWSERDDQYVLADGKVLPRREVKHYYRTTWRPKVDGLKVRLILERKSDNTVAAWLSETYDPESPGDLQGDLTVNYVASGKVARKFHCGADDSDRQRFAKYSEKSNRWGGTSSRGPAAIDLPEGGELQAQLEIEGRTITSPVLQP